MTRDDLLQLSQHSNVAAFLRVIRQAESNQTDDAYRVRWGGSYFDAPPWQHPGTALSSTDRAGREISSSASGAYQFLRSTWEEVARVYELPDFSPQWQDAGAVALIKRANALDDVLAGRLEAAIDKCNAVWAGLPGNRYGQGGISMQTARNVWARYGGQIVGPVDALEPPVARPQPQPEPTTPAQPSGPSYDEYGRPVHQPEQPMPAIASIVASAVVPELLKLLPWHKAEAKGVNVQAIQQAVIEAAKSAAAKPTLEEAATVVTTDQAAQQRFVQAVAVKWADIAPALQFEEQSRKDARVFVAEMTSTGPVWRQAGTAVAIALLSLLVVAGGGAMFWSMLQDPSFSAENKAMVLGALLAAFTSVIGWWFGSSASSRSKDMALEQAARRQ